MKKTFLTCFLIAVVALMVSVRVDETKLIKL